MAIYLMSAARISFVALRNQIGQMVRKCQLKSPIDQFFISVLSTLSSLKIDWTLETEFWKSTGAQLDDSLINRETLYNM